MKTFLNITTLSFCPFLLRLKALPFTSAFPFFPQSKRTNLHFSEARRTFERPLLDVVDLVAAEVEMAQSRQSVEESVRGNAADAVARQDEANGGLPNVRTSNFVEKMIEGNITHLRNILWDLAQPRLRAIDRAIQAFALIRAVGLVPTLGARLLAVCVNQMHREKVNLAALDRRRLRRTHR